MPATRRPSRRSSRQTLAEETIRAIKAGEVDAFVIADARGERTFTIGDEEQAYRLLMERMNEGAVTLTADGTVLYCNRRFAEIVRRPHSRVLGASLRDLVHPSDHARLDDLLADAGRSRMAVEFTIQRSRGAPIPVLLSLGPVPREWGRNGSGRRRVARTRIVGVVTDVTERREAARSRDRLHQRLMVAADEERRRIARELHDETGQSLTALLVGLRALADSATLKGARMSALRLRELAARTLDDVGRLARGLHPSVLDELGLVPAATRHVEEFNRTFGVAVTLRVKGMEEHQVPLPLATAVYRLLQEALTNIARHANARTARIALHVESHRIVLEVRDDGIGFNAQGALESETRKERVPRLGLLSMRERTALFGGTLDVRSAAGRGTTIIARLPLSDASLRNGRRPAPGH